MTKPKLIVGTVNNQPLGMKYEKFEELYQYCYKPFLKLLNTNPDVYAVLYYSGILLEHLEEYHPEFIMLLHDLIRRKQVELVGGAYYEPFLPLIPNTDKLGQIEFLTTYLRKQFGIRVRGCWVPFGVWDHILPFTLKNSGMDYAFLNTGPLAEKNEPMLPSITEEYGKSLIIYPVFSDFIHDFPKETPEESLKNLIGILSDTEGALASVLFPGDKLFNNPAGLKEREQWISDFFACVRENRSRIEYTLPGKYSRTDRRVKKKYYSPTSYGELMEWRGKPFTDDGGVFKKCLLEFPESNILYAKMMYVYQLVNQIRGDRSRKKTAREELWKGQGNSSFWYAKNGGVFRNSYRKAAFSALLEAEKLTREKGIFKSSIVVTDIDLDGFDEYLYQGNILNAYITGRGGEMFELDYLPGSWNYLDTFTQRDENGVCTPYLRRGFIDHIIPAGKTLEQFAAGEFRELSPGFNKTYTTEEVDRDRMRIQFSINDPPAGIKTDFSLRKQYAFKRSAVGVQYEIQTGDNLKDIPVFASELNLALPEPPGERVRVFAIVKGERKLVPEEATVLRQVSEVVIEDSINQTSLTISGSKRFRLWMFQIFTPYLTDSGEEREYQSTCIVPAWTRALGTMKPWDIVLTLKIEKLDKQNT